MQKRKVESSIVYGDVVFKIHERKLDFDIKQIATLFSTAISLMVPHLDLHWKDTTGFTVENKILKLVEQKNWLTVRVEELITSGIHYIELEVISARENAFLVGVVTKDFFEVGINQYITGDHGYGLYLPDGKLYNE